MRVSVLKGAGRVYSCNAYLLRGNWNRLEDVNTLIDAGTDGTILHDIAEVSTGVGKRGVEQVVLTHGHFDHTGGLPRIRERYHPEVYAGTPTDKSMRATVDGQLLHVGDAIGQILHTPGHSSDSLCLYVPSERALFSGDTPVRILSGGGTYTEDFLRVIERLVALPIDTIYPGHDEPIASNVASVLGLTLEIVRSEVRRGARP